MIWFVLFIFILILSNLLTGNIIVEVKVGFLIGITLKFLKSNEQPFRVKWFLFLYLKVNLDKLAQIIFINFDSFLGFFAKMEREREREGDERFELYKSSINYTVGKTMVLVIQFIKKVLERALKAFKVFILRALSM
jgi:hypothetical protein